MAKKISEGVVHDLPADLKKALSSDKEALILWEGLTPLARNEWICWTISVKQQKTRDEHVARVVSELKEGMRRPCCWIGCIHRTDKEISPSIKGILSKRNKGKGKSQD
ncbi:YdeI/OmpD-associated family protein [candidate division WWE3 bacterium]|uniref:YdeI/OmpD-associated family protein n=1 Tax=candidate division WWE3 bacterium TaxID=2053526 RepID=A0A955LKM7_UNCKA|nr:YdeI/OmpD-associated family protein [candidate division WWE3 bacterium]